MWSWNKRTCSEHISFAATSEISLSKIILWKAEFSCQLQKSSKNQPGSLSLLATFARELGCEMFASIPSRKSETSSGVNRFLISSALHLSRNFQYRFTDGYRHNLFNLWHPPVTSNVCDSLVHLQLPTFSTRQSR